jgi:predicted O-methyltransferase YrrM
MSISGGEQSLYHLGRLSEYLNAGNLLSYLDEIKAREELITDIENAVKDVDAFQTKRFNSIYDFRLYRIIMYVLVRALQPKIFVETGVLHGLTSVFILHALQKNQSGMLISVDLPSYYESGPSNQDGYNAVLPPGKNPGWVISEKHSPYWKLVLGMSLEELPKIFEEFQEIDMFCHDSEHTYETMWGELNLAWNRLKSGGILICDNVDNNSCFFDFTRKVERSPMLFPAPDERPEERIRFGIIRK